MVRLKSRRKKQYVNARVQGRIIGRMAAYWILYHFVLWHGLFVYRYAQHRLSSAGGGTAMPFREMYGEFWTDYSPLLFCAALILPLFMIDFVRMTHRIVGPLVRVRHALHQLMDGQRVNSVEFRKGDLLTEFESEFNEFLAFYDSRRLAASARPEEPEGLTEAEADLVAKTVSTGQPEREFAAAEA